MSKGPVSIDSARLAQTIIQCNALRSKIESNCETILNECEKMKNNESLVGGDGEDIRTAFKNLGEGTTKMKTSTVTIINNLNSKLEKVVSMYQGASEQVAADAKTKGKALGQLAD